MSERSFFVENLPAHLNLRWVNRERVKNKGWQVPASLHPKSENEACRNYEIVDLYLVSSIDRGEAGFMSMDMAIAYRSTNWVCLEGASGLQRH